MHPDLPALPQSASLPEPPRELVHPVQVRQVQQASPPEHPRPGPQALLRRSISQASPEPPALPVSVPAIPRHSPPSPAGNDVAPSQAPQSPPAHPRPYRPHLPSLPQAFHPQPRRISDPPRCPWLSRGQSHRNTACTARRCWCPQSIPPRSIPTARNSVAREPQNIPAAACPPAIPDAATGSETPRRKPSDPHSTPAAWDALPQSSTGQGSERDQ